MNMPKLEINNINRVRLGHKMQFRSNSNNSTSNVQHVLNMSTQEVHVANKMQRFQANLMQMKSEQLYLT